MLLWGLAGSAQTVKADLAQLRAWQAGAVVSQAAIKDYGEAHCFTATAIPDAVFARMQGKSYPKGCPISRGTLRYVRVLHYDGEGHIRLGELVCHRAIAADLVEIFRELYRHHYPIQSIRLIDDYGASDEASMRANNTSAFCYRVTKGSRHLSPHARGMAVDLNTLYNPYYKKTRSGKVILQPSTAGKYIDRSKSFPYKIDKDDLAYKLFTQHRFRWGGSWRSLKDWQHFEASLPPPPSPQRVAPRPRSGKGGVR